jgi:Permuted papain-like amidase enzyme, YaeF/YiiX, C92 family
MQSILALACAASMRGYFLPDEEEVIRLRYSQYLGLRAALLETLEGLSLASGNGEMDWGNRLPVFATAFATACILLRADRFLIQLAADRPVVWKKLDEADPRAGIPRKSFTAIYKALSDPGNSRKFLSAVGFYEKHRSGIRELAADPVAGPVVDLLLREEPWIERRKRDALKRAVSYRWFSFLRRNRSAWKKVMLGIFEVSGRTVAELRQPGVKPLGAPKRISGGLRAEVLELARPGDVFITRHDDALSNLFLPGFWPHAALYLGSGEEMTAAGLESPECKGQARWFLESKKDGVRIRPAEETLQVDAFLILRPPLEREDLFAGLRGAAGHVGKAYDFLFDFRTAERLVCTEVIYRGFHGLGPLRFHLKEVGGRLCLPAEDFIDQAMACGFQLVATGGLRGDLLLTDESAGAAFLETRNRAAGLGFDK